MASSNSMVCAICHGGTLRRAFCLPCGHSYCHTCTARALWEKPSCPSCRAETKTAAPAWEQRGKEEQANATLISVRHRGVAFTIDLAENECPYERTSIMFSVPADRLKLICRGKQLARGSDPQLAGAVIQLIGSRQEQHLHGERRGALRRNFEETGARMLDWARPVLACLRVPTWREALQWPVAACRGLLLFFASLLPYSIAAMLLPEAMLLPAPRRTLEHQD